MGYVEGRYTWPDMALECSILVDAGVVMRVAHVVRLEVGWEATFYAQWVRVVLFYRPYS